MRVTNSMLVSKYLNNLNNNMAKQDKLLNQLANNRKVSHYSEDPLSFIHSQSARQKLNRLAGYKAMVQTAQDWTVQVETSVMNINDVLASAYEASIGVSTDVKSGSDKKITSEYIGQLRDQLLQALNGSFGDKFVFGGYNTAGYTKDGKTVPPFTVDETTGHLMFNGCDLMSEDPADLDTIETLRKDILSLDVGPGISMPITFNGIDIVMMPDVKIPVLDEFGKQVTTPKLDGLGNEVLDAEGNVVQEPVYKTVNNMYNLLDEMYKMLQQCETITVEGDETATLEQRGATADIIADTFITPLQKAQRQILSVTATIGGRTNRLDMLQERYEIDELTYTEMKSNAEDADQAELIMRYKMAESVYNAALATGSYIIQPTLMDFLR